MGYFEWSSCVAFIVPQLPLCRHFGEEARNDIASIVEDELDVKIFCRVNDSGHIIWARKIHGDLSEAEFSILFHQLIMIGMNMFIVPGHDNNIDPLRYKFLDNTTTDA